MSAFVYLTVTVALLLLDTLASGIVALSGSRAAAPGANPSVIIAY